MYYCIGRRKGTNRLIYPYQETNFLLSKPKVTSIRNDCSQVKPSQLGGKMFIAYADRNQADMIIVVMLVGSLFVQSGYVHITA